MNTSEAAAGEMRLGNAVDAIELAALHAEWGVFPVEQPVLHVAHPFLTGENQHLANRGRRAEICYIMHRGAPAEGVLLHIKTFYPAGAYRLPTGGIQQGEAVMATLEREILEETGLQTGTEPHQGRCERCLGVLHYQLLHDALGTVDFATYHFLVTMPPDAQLAPQDPEEQIGGWCWTPAAELGSVADRLTTIGAFHPTWADWGRFRALSHRFVATALAD